MVSPSRSSYESLTLGFMLVAFAVSLLLAWALEDWWLLIPIFLIAAGAYYCVTTAATRVEKDRPYKLFWGGTMALIGVLWLVNMEFPRNMVLLVVVFILWVGFFAMSLAVARMRRGQAGSG